MARYGNKPVALTARSTFVVCFLTCLAGRPALADWRAEREKIDLTFRAQLEELAGKCQDLGLDEQAEQTRKVLVARDTGRQYLFLRPEVAKPARRTDHLIQQWHTKWLQLRAAYADKLFAVAEQANREGEATISYQLLYEVLRHDAKHKAAKVLNLPTERPVRPRSSRRPHPVWGWGPNRYWTVESPHFRIETDTSRRAAAELAAELEELHTVWRQLFFVFWSSPEALAARFSGRAEPLGALPKHQVVLFRDRNEYVERLVQIEPGIAGSLGYYVPKQQKAFFYSGEGSKQGTRFHEVTHQLFQETGFVKRDAGESWNVWVLEGIAVYMESLRRFGGYYTVGGFDAERLQFARARRFGGSFFMPFSELMGFGRRELQGHELRSMIYSQAAGLVHGLMDHEEGRYRRQFLSFLASVYARQDRPDSLYTILDQTPEELDRFYVEALQVDDSDLLALTKPDGIQTLALGRTRVTDRGTKVLTDCRDLTSLDLSHTRVTNETLKVIAKLKNLEELELAHTGVDDAGIRELGGLPKLRYLGLAGTSVTDAALKHVRTLPRLQQLDVDDTKVTPSAVRQFDQRNQP